MTELRTTKHLRDECKEAFTALRDSAPDAVLFVEDVCEDIETVLLWLV